jgi:tetratricopeptide (TPR) repeat protein
VRRREFLAAAAGLLIAGKPSLSEPVKVHYRRPPPYEPYIPLIEPGRDEFPEEKSALQVAARVREWWNAQGGRGEARFYLLPDNLVRFEIKSPGEYRTGLWKLELKGEQIARVTTVEEDVAKSAKPLFRDVTGAVFEGVQSFHEQLSRGIPCWVARIDPAAGIDIYGSNGLAAGDIDNDGIDELYVCQPGGLPNRLYKNVDGRFVDISEKAGLDILDDSSCALFLDVRNIGRQDLVLLRANGPALFLNNGDGTFRLKGDAFQFKTQPQGGFTGMAAADYNLDGKLDLYLCSYLFFQSEAQYRYPVPYHDARNGPPNFLFRNGLDAEGNGAFIDVTAEAGLNHNNDRFSFAPAWCDYDGDGWPDLYVANDFGRNNLYKNDNGKFRDIAAEARVEDIGPGMSAAWFDYDRDGRPDLYVSNMWSDAGQRVTRSHAFQPAQSGGLSEAYRRHTKGNSLYCNRGDGSFAETGADERVEGGRWAWSSDAHDFDCDGAPEIFVTCGMMTNSREPDMSSFFWRQVVAKSPVDAKPAAAYESGWNAINQFIREGYSWNGHEPNVFFVRCDGRYRDYSGVSGLDVAEDGRAFTVTDLTGDGALDLVLKSRLGPQVRVFENQCAGARNRIVFRLRGTKSNRDAIGARVDVDGQVKWMSAGSGYLSQHTKKLHFGIGDRTSIRKMKVTWPSGLEQAFGPLDAGFEYTVEEGSADFKKIALRARFKFPETVAAVPTDNRPALESTWFLEPIPLPDPRRGPGLVSITSRESAETLAAYSLFRRYLFEWRADLELPLYLLVDEKGRARKIYASQPTAAQVDKDIALPARPLPFKGRYLVEPRRNLFKIGAALLWSGYSEQALPYLEAELERTPRNVRTMVLVAQIHLEAKRTQEARRVLQQAIAIDPASAEAWNELGGVEMAEGNPKRAIERYLKALDIKSDLTYAMLNAAQAYAELGDHASAERFFTRALETDPQSAEAANGLGLALANQNRLDEAKRAFERAIEIRRDYASAINNLGVLYTTRGDTNNAIAAFRYGIQVAPDEDLLYLNLGRVYVNRGERDQARRVIEQWLERKPGNETANKALRALDGER